jgi:uncharacterized YigZ family protein
MKTVNQTYEQTLEIMKSKFISILMPLNNPDDFKETLKTLQKEHRKARHICFAYKVGQKTKCTDDGEPKGTAGRPLMEFLLKKELDNVALIVIRYFGGTKLGAGRLLRTYVQAGVNVVNSAQIVEKE